MNDTSVKVFISYANRDLKIAKKVYNDLKDAGLTPWMNEKDIDPGQNKKEAIHKAIQGSSYFLILLSENLLKKGYVHKELKEAFDILDKTPPSDIFIIPVRLDDYYKTSHEKLEDIKHVDLFLDYKEGLKKIIRVLKSSSDKKEIRQHFIDKDVLRTLAGPEEIWNVVDDNTIAKNDQLNQETEGSQGSVRAERIYNLIPSVHLYLILNALIIFLTFTIVFFSICNNPATKPKNLLDSAIAVLISSLASYVIMILIKESRKVSPKIIFFIIIPLLSITASLASACYILNKWPHEVIRGIVEKKDEQMLLPSLELKKNLLKTSKLTSDTTKFENRFDKSVSSPDISTKGSETILDEHPSVTDKIPKTDTAFGFDQTDTKRFRNSIGMEFLYIPPGSFMMGSPENEMYREDDEKQHKVTLTKGFYMQTTEVIVGQWKRFANETGYKGKSEYSYGCKNMGITQNDGHPVACVTWNDVQEFIKWLNKKESASYRLPTEAEWEYSARAGTETSFANGNITDRICNDSNLGKIGWYCGNSGNETHPVAEKQPNNWGLYDMHGNVSEWCQDSCDWDGEGIITDTYRDGVTDPVNTEGSDRVARGGYFSIIALHCRSAGRSSGNPDSRYTFVGFRLSRDVLSGHWNAEGKLKGYVKDEDIKPAYVRNDLPSVIDQTNTKRFRNSIGMDFVYIPPGSFIMGRRGSQHRVSVTESFYMQTTEVTLGQWKKFADKTGYKSDVYSKYDRCKDTAVPGGLPQSDEHPVGCVTYYDTQAFINWLNKRENTDRYRISTSTEWEYACRAGSNTRFHFGNNEGQLQNYAWYSGNSGNKVHSVGQKRPNDWGLYDMHGNMDEWCSDFHSVLGQKTYLAVRSGNYKNNAQNCRTEYLIGASPNTRDYHRGFRLSMSSPQGYKKLLSNFMSEKAANNLGIICHLRSKPQKISDGNIQAMLDKYNFFSSEHFCDKYGGCNWIGNESGDFNNNFEDNKDGTVTDHTTGLMWQKSGSNKSIYYYKEAQVYIDKLNYNSFAGYDDWRLPTVEELASLLESKRVDDSNIDPLFDRKQQWCWSSDKYKGRKFDGKSLVVDFFEMPGIQLHLNNLIRKSSFVRAVRSKYISGS